MHWPVSMKKGSVGFKPENLTQPDIPATWKAMEALYDSGKARAIGVSNFSSKKLGDLMEIARVPPAVIQVECHLVWQQPKLHAFCKSKGVHLTVSMQILCGLYFFAFEALNRKGNRIYASKLCKID
jgi:alcohol dehydrogenase (NADP+)